ncbi:pentapeptide repeat-containing protein [Pacificibacter marinus]|uniref:Pentapeptide repeats (8 copies) n=1 Tax=Pacificibacter marinus TaxID=658057 RepID=A0A1Y5RL79_9RHOB|nr:pentapeptide repeat-containing protein [Pacificibacter marinus]SEK17580.1 Pentapeptide repeat-containing protein [Pacificibacter marinus]SLN20116.1 hypothetical protein PAM7971_00603 [Pacificibacter marinus]
MSEKNEFEQFLSQVDGVVFHPLTLGFVGFAVLSSVIVFAMNNAKHGKSNPLKFSETLWLNYVYWFAIFFAPILAIIFVSILAMLTQVGFRILSGNTMQGEADNLRWYVLSFVGLLTALGGIIGTPLALIRVHTTERQTKTSEQNLLTDTLNKAIENLGASKAHKRQVGGGTIETTVPALEKRIGAILALERLASNDLQMHIEIMRIITAYLRTEITEFSPASDKKEKTETVPLREDLSVALAVLSRRGEAQRRLENREAFVLELDNTCFANLRILDVSFEGISLNKCLFSNCYIRNVEFSNCSIHVANAFNTRLEQCSFEQTELVNTRFQSCKFSDCDLGAAANIGESSFIKVDFRNCSIPKQFLDTGFWKELTNCWFYSCDLSNLDFEEPEDLETIWGDQFTLHPQTYQGYDPSLDLDTDFFDEELVNIPMERPKNWEPISPHVLNDFKEH